MLGRSRRVILEELSVAAVIDRDVTDRNVIEVQVGAT